MGIKDFLERLRAKKHKYKEFEDEQKMQQKFIERSKSANERELERFMKEKREDDIKTELEEFRRKRQIQAQYGNQIIKVKNMFKNNGNEIINQRNLFTGNRNLFEGKGGIFFK